MNNTSSATSGPLLVKLLSLLTDTFVLNLHNFPQTQTQAQDAQNLLQSKSLLNSKVSVRSEDTGNAKFVQNYNREIFLEKSLF